MAARLFLNTSAELLRRIRAEYLEMPGLRLTASQAQCLFGLDSETWGRGPCRASGREVPFPHPQRPVRDASNTGLATGRTSGIGRQERDELWKIS